MSWGYLFPHFYRWLIKIYVYVPIISSLWSAWWVQTFCFVVEIEIQLECRAKTLWTKHSCKYLSHMFKGFCEDKGVWRQLTIHGIPQQNSVVEHMNWTMLDLVRSTMTLANLPISFWGDALLTGAYILNCTSSKSVSTTLYELWHDRNPL